MSVTVAQAGTACLAFNGQGYERVVISRVNEDGTYSVRPVGPDGVADPFMELMGVSQAEVLLDDRARWQQLFPSLCADGKSFGINDFVGILRLLGKPVEMDKLSAFWARRFPSPPDADGIYQVVLDIGYSARQLQELKSGVASQPPALHKQYINNLRLGGRDPSEVARKVTTADVFQALGIANQPDAAATAIIDQAESQSGVKLPDDLRALLTLDDLRGGLANHSLGPQAVLPTDDGWKIHDIRARAVADGDFAVELINENQGICTWLAVFRPGDSESRVYVTDFPNLDSEPVPVDPLDRWKLASPSLNFFVWDLMQTAMIWNLLNDPSLAARIRRTDIGLAMNPPAE